GGARGGGDRARPAGGPGPRGPRRRGGGPRHAGGAGARRFPATPRGARRPLPQPRLRRGQRRGGAHLLDRTMTPSVAITGIGFVGPPGCGAEAAASALARGEPVVRAMDGRAGYLPPGAPNTAALVDAEAL